jgi:hypothetical protein
MYARKPLVKFEAIERVVLISTAPQKTNKDKVQPVVQVEEEPKEEETLQEGS